MKNIIFTIYIICSLTQITKSQTVLDQSGHSVLRNTSSSSGWTGTTNLTLAATAAQNSGFKLSYEANSNPRIGRLTLNNSWGGIYGDFAISLRNVSGIFERFRIKNNGFVGIGTTNPLTNLDVNGDAYISNLRIVEDISIGNETSWIYSKAGTERQLGLLLTNDSRTKAEIKLWEGNSHNPYISFSTSPVYNSNIIERMRIDKNGNVGIGTTSMGSHKLAVEGSIGAREIKVEAFPGWSDFVFEADYELRTLEEVENYIAENNHLPEIPNEAEVTENGINLGEMNAKLLQKIEELTLYLIEQNKEINKMKKEISTLKNE